MTKTARNVLGEPLIACSTDPLTGFYRDGCCNTGEQDQGLHLVCCVVTADFLAFSQSVGNDLSTPRPEYHFPGLNPGDRWCVCVQRWVQAEAAGCAPKVVLAATHIATLEFADRDTLNRYAIDNPQ